MCQLLQSQLLVAVLKDFLGSIWIHLSVLVYLVLFCVCFFIMVVLSCDCVQVHISFYSYPSIFQVITYRPVFVLTNVNCYVIDAFMIQFVVSKITVMYPPCQSFKCFFIKILFVNIWMVDTFLNKYFIFFFCAYFIAVKYWNVTDDGTSFLSIILRNASMVAVLLLRICSSVLCLFHGLCMMSIPRAQA